MLTIVFLVAKHELCKASRALIKMANNGIPKKACEVITKHWNSWQKVGNLSKTFLKNFLTEWFNIIKHTPIGYIMDQNRKKISNRLRRIEGQIRGIQRLIEQEAPCIDILTQVSAVTSAMKKTGGAIISNYMKTCIEESSDNPEKLNEDFRAALSRFIDLS